MKALSCHCPLFHAFIRVFAHSEISEIYPRVRKFSPRIWEISEIYFPILPRSGDLIWEISEILTGQKDVSENVDLFDPEKSKVPGNLRGRKFAGNLKAQTLY